MSWFKKIAKDFSQRNLLNEKIRYLSDMLEKIQYNSKVVFQSGKFAKDSTFEIVSSKKITSYPLLYDMLIEANEIVLDSPWRYQSMCEAIIDELSYKIGELKEERKKITEGDDSKKKVQKGLIYDRK